MIRFLPLFALLGCPKTPELPTPVWDETPRLPAPIAGVYARSPEIPTDVALAKFVIDKPWDASLSGAAAGLALKLVNEMTHGPGLTRWRVREALWKAGYPFPARDARAWTAAPDGGPPPQLLAWLDGFPEGDDLGLVRARGHDEDLWVALRATPSFEFGRIPRQVPEGGSLELPAASGATYIVSDANGLVVRGELDSPAQIECNIVGEWMVKIVPQSGPAAVLPVYVGMMPPELGLIRDVASIRTPTDALARAESLLREIRGAYGTTPLQRDFALDAGARSLLRGDAGSAEGVRNSLGLPPEKTTLWQCRGTTIEACFDSVIWEPENRLALLDERSTLGLAADLDASGVHLVGIVSVTH